MKDEKVNVNSNEEGKVNQEGNEEKKENIENEPKTEEAKEGKQKKNKKKDDKKINILSARRKGNRYITTISNLKAYEINVKDLSKKIGKKFACGSSVTKEENLEYQGQNIEDLIEFLCKEFPNVNTSPLI